MPGRPDLELVRQQYQVESDEIVHYAPRAFGTIDLPIVNPYDITQTEASMLDALTLDRGVHGLAVFHGRADLASTEARRRFPDNPLPEHISTRSREDQSVWQGNDGHRDAFRHAYWNALLTHQYGAEWTERFTTAHEGQPGSYATREAMDLYNNEVGRRIALDHPNVSAQVLATRVNEALTDGRLIVINAEGALEWSDRVRVGQHGLSGKEQLPGRIPTPTDSSPPDTSKLRDFSAADHDSRPSGSGLPGHHATALWAGHPIYQAIRNQTPAHVSDDQVAWASVQAMRNGIDSAAAIKTVIHQQDGGSHHLFVLGNTPGFRTSIDLNQPAPSHDALAQELEALQLRGNPTAHQQSALPELPVHVASPHRG